MTREQVSKDNDNEEILIRPYKWSCWDFEIFMREQEDDYGNLTQEFAYITTEHKWVTLAIEDGDYNLVPVEQHKLLAPLFDGITTSTDMYFVIDGLCGVDEADGGYIDMEFSEQHLKTEYATLQKLNGNHDLCESEILFEMGFKEYEDKMDNSNDYTRTVICFQQRKLGE
jgi:hypothetical protein